MEMRSLCALLASLALICASQFAGAATNGTNTTMNSSIGKDMTGDTTRLIARSPNALKPVDDDGDGIPTVYLVVLRDGSMRDATTNEIPSIRAAVERMNTGRNTGTSAGSTGTTRATGTPRTATTGNSGTTY